MVREIQKTGLQGNWRLVLVLLIAFMRAFVHVLIDLWLPKVIWTPKHDGSPESSNEFFLLPPVG